MNYEFSAIHSACFPMEECGQLNPFYDYEAKMKKILLLLMVLVMTSETAMAGLLYNYINPDEFKGWVESGKPMHIVDIQVADEFQKHHFKNSIETNAYPVKTDEERKKIDKALEEFKKNDTEIVVVCPRGGGGAKRSYDYLKENGVPEVKLYILKGGVEKWPYKEMLEKTVAN